MEGLIFLDEDLGVFCSLCGAIKDFPGKVKLELIYFKGDTRAKRPIEVNVVSQ